MRLRSRFAFAGFLFALASAFELVADRAEAQTNIQIGQPGAGVVVDASGVLRMQSFPDPSGEVMRAKLLNAKAALAADVATPSALRKISLNRLEKAIEAQIAAGKKPTEEMNLLAGLTRLQYVFFYPETNDVVIAGPAEGWVSDLSGRMIGLKTGQPVIELQDLVAALRTFAPGGRNGSIVGCSIDPTQEGLAKMQQFLTSIYGQVSPSDEQMIVDGLHTTLGMQTVKLFGVAADTHFAQVLVEADYRMKLIAIGLEQPQVKMNTYIAKATGSSRNSLVRWYFVPDYKCVRSTEDGQAMELVGQGVKLVDENEVVMNDGSRKVSSGTRDGASMAFTASFTQKYPEIAAIKPIYAQLKNLIDLTIAAAYLQKNDFYGQADWRAATLMSEEKLPIQTYTAPVQVDNAVTSVWKGNKLLTPIAGGVTIQARQALVDENLQKDDRGLTAKAKQSVTVNGLKDGQWWWD